MTRTFKSMSDFDKSFNRMQTFIKFFFALVFTLIICWFIFLGVIAFKVAVTAAEQDWSAGIKPVIEQVWCGKPGCLNVN